MNVKKTRVGLLIAILTFALMFSLFTVSAFAETTADATTAAAATTAAETPAATTAAATTAAATTGDGHNHDGHNHDGEDNLDTIISLIVGGVILVVIAIVCIIKREALAKFLRSLKSEMGKIVWLPKNQTLKSTVVVLIIVAICAIVIGILDFAFGSGITFLGKLF